MRFISWTTPPPLPVTQKHTADIYDGFSVARQTLRQSFPTVTSTKRAPYTNQNQERLQFSKVENSKSTNKSSSSPRRTSRRENIKRDDPGHTLSTSEHAQQPHAFNGPGKRESLTSFRSSATPCMCTTRQHRGCSYYFSNKTN